MATKTGDINVVVGHDVMNKPAEIYWLKQFTKGLATWFYKKSTQRPISMDIWAVHHRSKRDDFQSSAELLQRICSKITIKLWVWKRGRNWRPGRNNPHELALQQTKNRVDTCQRFLRHHRRRCLLSQIISAYDSWAYCSCMAKRSHGSSSKNRLKRLHFNHVTKKSNYFLYFLEF